MHDGSVPVLAAVAACVGALVGDWAGVLDEA
jgi:hypothetical protein